MKIISLLATVLGLTTLNSCAQTLKWENQEFEISNVKASVTELHGKEALRIERDLEALPFDKDNLFNTVDEPTFVKIKDLNFVNGTIEIKVLSRLLKDAPEFARGFIGIAFRINEDNSSYESIYLRPTNGRADDQLRRNHTIQYYAYPDYKFNVLRENSKGEFETYADIGLDEWITMRVEVEGKKATLYLNDKEYPSFVVSEMKGNSTSGSIGLWVEIGTEGFFKDLKITKND
ncbi:family 16 glycoside hydrolase [Sinomicrobium sp. M5D2P17]